jgi:hypothetical protein
MMLLGAFEAMGSKAAHDPAAMAAGCARTLAMNGRHIMKRNGSLPGLERAATARHFIGRRLALRSRASHREQKWI